MANALDERIGLTTAYGYAKLKGYTGTEEQFAQALANAGITLEQIETVIDTFVNTTVPNAVQSVTSEGTTQVSAVHTAGQTQITNITSEGTTQVSNVNTAGAEKVNAVNTTGETQVSAVNSAGSTQVGNVNTAGATQVGAVNTAGSNQIAAIQAKGEETRQSIPADYTALSDSVEDLKTALDPYDYHKNVVSDVASLANTAMSGTTGEILTLNGWKLTYFPVSKGEKLDATVTFASSVANSYGFINSLPAIGSVATILKTGTTTQSYHVTYTFDEDGYFIISSVNVAVTISGTLEAGKILDDEINNIYTDLLAVANGYENHENVSVNKGSAVYISTGEVADFSSYPTWATSDLYRIPLGTIRIESNFNNGVGSTTTFGYAVYDENENFITGGQALDALTIEATYKYIRMTNYDAQAQHSGLYVNFILRDLSNKSAFEGKTCICFGDSITWYDGNAYNWGKFEGQTAKGFESWLRDELNLSVTNAGVGGQTSLEICTRLKATALTSYDFLTLTAGANDERHNTPLGVVLEAGSTFDTTTFCGAFQSAIEYALTQNDEMKIILCTPIQGWIYADGYDETDYPEHPTSGDIDPKWADAIKRIADIYALPVCDWYSKSGINLLTRNVYINDPEPPTNTLYSLHPTPKGYERMSEILIDTFNLVKPLEV